MNSKQLSFDISSILSFYLNEQINEYKNAVENFAKNYYLLAKEKIEDVVDKQEIIYYERIIATYNIFDHLLTAEDDYADILRMFSSRKDYYPMLEIIYKEKYISHSNLARQLNKTSQALTDYVKKIPDYGLFVRERNRGTIYFLTNKGKKLVEQRKRELDILNLRKDYNTISNKMQNLKLRLIFYENEIAENNDKINKVLQMLEFATKEYGTRMKMPHCENYIPREGNFYEYFN